MNYLFFHHDCDRFINGNIVSVDLQNTHTGSKSDKARLFTCGTCLQTFKKEFDMYVHESFNHASTHCLSDDEEADGRGLGATISSPTRKEQNSDRHSNTDEGTHIHHIKIICLSILPNSDIIFYVISVLVDEL